MLIKGEAMWIALLGSLLAIGVALLCLLALYDLSAGRSGCAENENNKLFCKNSISMLSLREMVLILKETQWQPVYS
jgi:hypothetical protein